MRSIQLSEIVGLLLIVVISLILINNPAPLFSAFAALMGTVEVTETPTGTRTYQSPTATHTASRTPGNSGFRRGATRCCSR